MPDIAGHLNVVPNLSSCCCGCTLRTGTIIITICFLIEVSFGAFVEPPGTEGLILRLVNILSLVFVVLGVAGAMKSKVDWMSKFLYWSLFYLLFTATFHLIVAFDTDEQLKNCEDAFDQDKQPEEKREEFIKFCMRAAMMMSIGTCVCSTVIQAYCIWVVKSFVSSLYEDRNVEIANSAPPVAVAEVATAKAIPWSGASAKAGQTRSYQPLQEHDPPQYGVAVPVSPPQEMQQMSINQVAQPSEFKNTDMALNQIARPTNSLPLGVAVAVPVDNV